MKKVKTPFHGIKLFTGIALCIIMTSCNRQANNGDKQNVMKEEKLLPTDSNFEIDQTNNQISGVILPYCKTVGAIFGLELKMVCLNYLGTLYFILMVLKVNQAKVSP